MWAHQQRRDRLIGLLPDTVDGVLITRVVNVRYLTGFTGSNAALLVPRDGSALFATDGRYVTQAADQVPDVDCVETRSVAAELVDRAARAGLRRLGIEGHDVTLHLHEALRAAAADRVELVVTDPIVSELRAVKDDAELSALTRACEITDASFAAIQAELRPGASERDVAWALRRSMRDHGAEALAFDSIVAFGPHSAIPHHEPTDRELARGDLVKLDFGARYDGYHADMTRTVVMAPAADWQCDLHALVRDVQEQCAEATVVGAQPSDLDDLARGLIENSGHAVAHGLGHGVGLEIHELPFLTAASPAPALVGGIVLTVEPGIYLPGRGGVRIEDTVAVGGAGPTSLTTSTRDLVEVG